MRAFRVPSRYTVSIITKVPSDTGIGPMGMDSGHSAHISAAISAQLVMVYKAVFFISVSSVHRNATAPHPCFLEIEYLLFAYLSTSNRLFGLHFRDLSHKLPN